MGTQVRLGTDAVSLKRAGVRGSRLLREAAAAKTLRDLDVPYEANVISTHRAPRRLEHYCGSAEERGIRALICAAGGAAHLAGVAAALTPIPVLACPMKAWSLEGLDSLLSMAQMPKGIPVATFAIGSAGATNAALFAVAMLAGSQTARRRRPWGRGSAS